MKKKEEKRKIMNVYQTIDIEKMHTSIISLSDQYTMTKNNVHKHDIRKNMK